MATRTEAGSIRRGASTAPDAATAVRELAEAILHEDVSYACFFASPSYELGALAAALREHFDGVPLVGCTTAGEIGPAGYLDDSISGFSLSAPEDQVEIRCLEKLEDFELQQGVDLANDLVQSLGDRAGELRADNTFAFLLIDGLSVREEAVVSAVHGALGDLSLFGGSAGDALNFGSTQVWYDGDFRENAAVLTLVHTQRPFRVFRTQHFRPSGMKLVVTEADPLRRIVTGINGAPAGREYARILGLEGVDELTPMIFSSHPLLVRVGGSDYIRSIAKVNEDESLSFFCAIDEGIVLTVAEGSDLLSNFEAALEEMSQDLGSIELVIGCDCILRSLELDQDGHKQRLAETLSRYNFVGFSTYGEQFDAMHVNQTLTGVALGRGEDD